MAKKKDEKKGDPLKSFTLVMGLLVLVMGGLYFVIAGQRDDWIAGNARLEDYATKGDTYQDIAKHVLQLAKTYEEAVGKGAATGGFSASLITAQAARAHMKIIPSGSEDATNRGGVRTIRQAYDYRNNDDGEPTIWQLLTAVYNIESQTRYRVSELTWELTDKPETVGVIKKNRLRIATRGPIQVDR